MTSALTGLYQSAPDTISADDTVLVAAERMRQRTVGCLIVIDGGNKPIGIVTDRDLVIRVLADGREPSDMVVRDVMTPDVVTINNDSPLSSALQRMREGVFRRLPVVDERGHLAGIVCLDDIIMQLAHHLDEVAKVLQQETPAAAGTSGFAAR